MMDTNTSPTQPPDDDFSYADAPTAAPDESSAAPLFLSPKEKRRPDGHGLSNPFWNR